eukprot:339665_1
MTHRRQPLNDSLPPPSNRHTGYSSDEYQHPYIANDKSRIDNLVRHKSLDPDIDALDQSPRGNFKKRATSPFPPPPRSQKLYAPTYMKDSTSPTELFFTKIKDTGYISPAGSFFTKVNDTGYISPAGSFFTKVNDTGYISPAGSFFAKIKDTANNEDDYKHNIKPKKVGLPEPTVCTDNDEFNGTYSDSTSASTNTYNTNTHSSNNTNNTKKKK